MFALACCVLVTNGFLLTAPDCPIRPPCKCYDRLRDVDVICYSRNITSVHWFNNSTIPRTGCKDVSVDFSSNFLSMLPHNAFFNLSIYCNHNITKATILLRDNHLTDSSFENTSFNGIESKIEHIDLSENYITRIPWAMSKLINLIHFAITDNPIHIVDPDVFLGFGHTLDVLSISLPGVQSWPTAFNNLTVLDWLHVDSFKYNVPSYAFIGFEKTLSYLYYYSMPMDNMKPICRLRALGKLGIGGNQTFNGSTILRCESPIATVWGASFEGKVAKEFMNVFDVFPNVRTLEYENCDIADIEGAHVPNDTLVTSFYFTNCKLQKIPSLLNKLYLLEKCSLYGNQIRRIETDTLRNLRHLNHINLHDNPIQFIAKNAFQNLPALTYLSLDHTLLTVVPDVVEVLPSLRVIILRNDVISCDCAIKLSKLWAAHTTISIMGTCRNSTQTIGDYIRFQFLLCP